MKRNSCWRGLNGLKSRGGFRRDSTSAQLPRIAPISAWTLVLLITGTLVYVADRKKADERRIRGQFDVVRPMEFPGENWEQVPPESQGIDSKKLSRAVRWFRKRAPRDGVNELVIARNGQLVWSGPDIDRVHGVWSVTKVFSSTALGLLIDDEKCDLHTRVAEILPAMETDFADVTFRHFATMTSGYQAEGDWPPANHGYLNGSSATPFSPAAPQFPPGTHFSYWDSAMNQFGLALTRVAGESLESLFEQGIAGSIGMNSSAWNWKEFAEVDGIAVNGGSGNKGKHIEISARELARFGHLMLNRGRWRDRQLLSETWVDLATSPQVPAELPLGGPIADRYGDRFPFDGRGVYGFNWWANGVRPDGNRNWPGLPEGTFAAIGYNNNRLFIIPEWQLVVVRLGLDGKDRRIERQEYASFLLRIGKAIID